MIDSAGIRPSQDDLESEGIQKAQGTIEKADVCLWVLDGSAPPSWPLNPLGSFLYVVNKIDFPMHWDHSQAQGAVLTSATVGTGLEELCAAISERLVPQPPGPGDPVPYTPELCKAVDLAWNCCKENRMAVSLRVLESIRAEI